MVGLLQRGGLLLLLACPVTFWLPLRGSACPFCTMRGPTLTNEVGQASLVLVGTVRNAKMGDAPGQGTTELVIEAVIKKHALLGDGKVITLARYQPANDQNVKFLVFCDVIKGRIDPYRGVALRADCDVAGYLTGALKIQDKKVSERLAYYFQFLDNKEIEISDDAYREFGNAAYQDYRVMAGNLPADRIARWLQDPGTPAFRFGLYGLMLGHCGREEHARLLGTLLVDPAKREHAGIDGLLAGYILLKPQEGRQFLAKFMQDPATVFTQRHAVLRALSFFWDQRPEVMPKKEVMASVASMLEQGDMADLAIEQLRKWSQWQLCERILALSEKKSHEAQIIQRAILRFALSCQNSEGAPKNQAAAFVNQLRQKDARLVGQAEELLRLEAAPLPSTAPGVSK